MNSRQVWNSHQRRKFLRTEGSRDILKIRVSEIAFPGVFKVFLTTDATLFRQDTCKTGNNAIKMSLAFQDIAQFERFTDLNLLEDALNVIQNWETDALQFYSMVLNHFLLTVMEEGDESNWLRMAN